MNWTPLHIRTHFSLQRALTKPEEIAAKCKEYGYEACAITDFNTISGAVSFYKACKKYGIKPILGCTLEIENEVYTYVAKNKSGWYELIDLVTKYNSCTPDEMLKHMNSTEGDSNLIRIDHISPKEIYYMHSGLAPLHRILLCSGMKTTLTRANEKMKKS